MKYEVYIYIHFPSFFRTEEGVVLYIPTYRLAEFRYMIDSRTRLDLFVSLFVC